MKKIICAALVTILFYGGQIKAEEKEKVVATIGDKVFTMADFDRWVGFNPEQGRLALASDNKMKANLLNQVISGMVIAEHARREGFDKLPEVAEKQQLLLNNFLTLEYLNMVVAAKANPTDEDILKYYEENKDQFRHPEMLRARHILVKVDRNATPEEKQAAQAKAQEILGQVEAGMDFAGLATLYSDDPGSSEKGGDLGLFPRGRMVPEFEKAAYALQPGETSGIVETDFGYHIIKVEEKRPATDRPLEDVRESITNTLSRDRKRALVDQFVQDAMKKADAKVNMDVLVGSDPHFGK